MMDLPERVVDQILFEPNTGHWLWLNNRNRQGYGRGTIAGRQLLMHRYVYTHLVGPIPDGMVIDHLCRVRHCVNPNHLRVVTPRQNTLENSLSVGAVRGAWTQCPQGHAFEGRNRIITKTGARLCRACRNAYMRELMRKRAAEQPYKSPYWAPREEVAAHHAT